MTETISQTLPPEPSPAELVRAGLCPLCWAPPGRPCSVVGPPGDHLARYIAAVKLGLLSRADLAAVVGALVVIADHVMILERAA